MTGRTHQIRLHLQHVGHPILNDPLYGGHLYQHNSYAANIRPPTPAQSATATEPKERTAEGRSSADLQARGEKQQQEKQEEEEKEEKRELSALQPRAETRGTEDNQRPQRRRQPEGEGGGEEEATDGEGEAAAERRLRALLLSHCVDCRTSPLPTHSPSSARLLCPSPLSLTASSVVSVIFPALRARAYRCLLHRASALRLHLVTGTPPPSAAPHTSPYA